MDVLSVVSVVEACASAGSDKAESSAGASDAPGREFFGCGVNSSEVIKQSFISTVRNFGRELISMYGYQL